MANSKDVVAGAARTPSAGSFLPDSIRIRLFLLIGLALLPVLLLLAWINYHNFETRRSNALQTEVEVARGVAKTFIAYAEGLHRASHAAGQGIITFTTYTEAKATRLLSSMVALHPTIRNLSWVSPEGIVLATTQEGLRGANLSGRPYFQEIRAGRPWSIGDLTRTGMVTTAPTLAIATAIKDDKGTMRGAVVAGIEPTRLRELTLAEKRPAGGAYVLFDRNGVLVYRNPEINLSWDDRVRWKSSDHLLRQALRTGKEAAGRSELEMVGGSWLSARVPIAGIGWVAGTGRPVTIAMAQVWQELVSDAVLALLVLLVAFLLAYLIARTIAEPLRHLERDAVEMASGILPVNAPSQAPIEVRRLRESVSQMATTLLQRAASLHKSEERLLQAMGETEKNRIAIQESEQRFRAIFDNAGVGMVEARGEDRFVAVNERVCEILGYSREELLNMNVHELTAPEDRDLSDRLNRQLHTGERDGLDYEKRYLRRDGSSLWVHVTVAAIRDSAGHHLRSIATIEDIGERKAAEEAMRESEQRLRAVMDHANAIIWMKDTAGRFMMVNRYMENVLGLSQDQLLGRTVSDFLQPNLSEEHEKNDRQVLETGQPMEFEESFSRNGQQQTYVSMKFPLRDAQDRIYALCAICTDISERKRIEEQLRLQVAALNAAANGMVITDRDGRIEWANPAFSEMTGYSLEEAIGQTPRILKSDKQDDGLYAKMWETIARGEVWNGQLVNQRKDGSLYAEEMSISPVLDERGEITHFIAIKQDITERKQAEEHLKESRQRLEGVVESAMDAIITINEEQRIVLFNLAAQQMFRLPVEKALGAPLDMLIPERFRGIHREHVRHYGETGETARTMGHLRPLSGLRADGEEFPIEASISQVQVGQRKLFTVILRDITERKRAEEALREREGELRLIMDAAPALISYVDSEFRYLRVNKSYEEWLGLTAEGIRGRHAQEVLDASTWQIVEPYMRRALEGELVTYERPMPTRDGQLRWAHITYSPDREDSGRVRGFVVHVVDITERKKAEEELLRLYGELEQRVEQRTAELAAANRELEAFSYSVSHDLRAPLRHVMSFVELLQKSAGPVLDEKGTRYVRVISDAAKRMGNLIDDLLMLSRIGRASMAETTVDLQQLVDEARQELTPDTQGRNIEWRIGELPQVKGDPTLLRAVIVNLLSNAIKYTRPREVACIEIDSYRQNGELVFYVRDNGVGFDMQFIDKLFGVFQRLHRTEEFEGTGIGLASIRRVIQRHGGRTWAEGEIGKGAIFYFSLPLKENVI